jgi:hypothetical protein
MAFAGLTSILLMVLYLWFAHPANWTVYYLEVHLVLAAAAAVGAARIAGWTIRLARAKGIDPSTPVRTGVPLLALAAIATLNVPVTANIARLSRASAVADHTAVREIASLLTTPAILFIRYAPDHSVHRGFIENRADLGASPVWRVHDLGVRNGELLRLAPERTPYLFDEGTREVSRLAPDGVTTLPFHPAPAP